MTTPDRLAEKLTRSIANVRHEATPDAVNHLANTATDAAAALESTATPVPGVSDAMVRGVLDFLRTNGPGRTAYISIDLMRAALEAAVQSALSNARDAAVADSAFLRSSLTEPVAWEVSRDTDYESREFFITEEAANANASLGLVDTYVRPLYAHPEVPVEPELPAHPEDFKYAALLRNHDRKRTKWIVVPHDQSLDFDEGTINRRWLHPHLGGDWHLFGFVSLVHPTGDSGALREALEPFVAFASENLDADDGSSWGGNRCERDRIVDWFGPSEFRRARDAYRASGEKAP